MIQLVCGAESRCLKVCTDGPLTDTDDEEDDVVVDHENVFYVFRCGRYLLQSLLCSVTI